VNKEVLLKPGMYARVELVIDRHAGALLVPSEAVAIDGDASAVFVVDKGVVARLPISTGESEGTLVEVVKGLKGEEQVITEGKELVRPGQKVRTEARK
jgi:membrane fusion protein (multidrug efflux system)